MGLRRRWEILPQQSTQAKTLHFPQSTSENKQWNKWELSFHNPTITHACGMTGMGMHYLLCNVIRFTVRIMEWFVQMQIRDIMPKLTRKNIQRDNCTECDKKLQFPALATLIFWFTFNYLSSMPTRNRKTWYFLVYFEMFQRLLENKGRSRSEESFSVSARASKRQHLSGSPGNTDKYSNFQDKGYLRWQSDGITNSKVS